MQVSHSTASSDLGSTRTLRMPEMFCWSVGMTSLHSMVAPSLSQVPSPEPFVVSVTHHLGALAYRARHRDQRRSFRAYSGHASAG